ncbi:helix-turn-helix domain-containing protein [Nonomuraea sp. NPDC048882]|uniref:helix-turn-helix domain-containing protein n=1 Tax=Nonomuraea sp. NPDC048882 TaxID=3154347 RepID=UPI0033C19F63
MLNPIGITAREAANAYNVSPRTIRRWAQTGRLDAAKDASGHWVITLDTPSLDGFKPAQVERARELIAQGGIVPVRGRRIFLAVSNDGDRTYLTAPQACNCKAGIKGRYPCFHRIAAVIMSAATAPVRRAA